MNYPNRPIDQGNAENDVLEALYREAAQDTDAEVEALTWVEAVPDDALEPATDIPG